MNQPIQAGDEIDGGDVAFKALDNPERKFSEYEDFEKVLAILYVLQVCPEKLGQKSLLSHFIFNGDAERCQRALDECEKRGFAERALS